VLRRGAHRGTIWHVLIQDWRFSRIARGPLVVFLFSCFSFRTTRQLHRAKTKPGRANDRWSSQVFKCLRGGSRFHRSRFAACEQIAYAHASRHFSFGDCDAPEITP